MEVKRRNRAIHDRTGEKFGRLTAVRLIERRGSRNHLWEWSCECGGMAVIGISGVVKGSSRSCGCLRREMLSARNEKHGMSKLHKREYRTWKDMRSRCNNPNNQDFNDYGGRGISVCERWDDFSAFLSDMGLRPEGMTIDRIDVNGDYEPLNCRWATQKTQANNKRNNRVLDNGKTLAQNCEELGISHSKVQYRLLAGYSNDDALSDKDFRK